jgi:hypothetical protein
MREKRVDKEGAEELLRRQFVRWDEAQIINSRWSSDRALPYSKVAVGTVAELNVERLERERLRLTLLTKLFGMEVKYQLALRRRGLAASLVLFQNERAGVLADSAREELIACTLRNYYFLRRAFKQGKTARDCLPRSLALAATLRQRGVEADLCIGVVDIPFSAHAWVESDGILLNDTLAKREEYTIIGRF